MSICVGSWLQSGGPTHWRCRRVVVNDYNELRVRRVGEVPRAHALQCGPGVG